MCRIITLVGVEHIRRMLFAFVLKISATPYFYPTRARENFEISEFPDNTSHDGYQTRALKVRNRKKAPSMCTTAQLLLPGNHEDFRQVMQKSVHSNLLSKNS